MPSVKADATIGDYRNFVQEVYGLPNERHFSVWDMMTNVNRFAMRSLKGIRKKDYDKAKVNLLISFSWFTSLTNKLQIDLEKAVWERFPYLCSYCASCPCLCKEEKMDKRQKVPIDNSKKPKTLEEYQIMFEKIYPKSSRTIEHASIHLAEEIGEMSEAILAYMGVHSDDLFNDVILEFADVFSCVMSVFNSLNYNIAEELSKLFDNNCHICHQAPCKCSFSSIVKFKS